MSKLVTFFKLNGQNKIILIKAFFLLWIIRIMLWIFPFSFIQRIVSRFSSVSDDKNHEVQLEKLTWAISVTAPYTLRATCLTRALAAQILLARYHYSSNIKIGVSKNEEEFEAHAWLEADDEIILGESKIDYTPILKIGET